MVYAFFDEVKKAGGILTKFWYPGKSGCMRSARRLLKHLFLVLEGSRACPRDLVALFFFWGLAGAVVVAIGQVAVLGSDVSFSVCQS